ncbi:hypothetical protein DFH11DRAFT_1546792 [Phellopilus nigrolimitatus]|nr:hypothetical protein DFH11DRAFT_1546792 [Phellopilus nigrolimitatus]
MDPFATSKGKTPKTPKQRSRTQSSKEGQIAFASTVAEPSSPVVSPDGLSLSNASNALKISTSPGAGPSEIPSLSKVDIFNTSVKYFEESLKSVEYLCLHCVHEEIGDKRRRGSNVKKYDSWESFLVATTAAKKRRGTVLAISGSSARSARNAKSSPAGLNGMYTRGSRTTSSYRRGTRENYFV